jgi:hypothetical protein
LAQYADNIVTITEFDDKAFIAGDKNKSFHILLADKEIEKGLIYTVLDKKKIKHNLSFLSPKLQETIALHQNNPNNVKNGYLDWFVIGTWICLFGCQLKNGKKMSAISM